MCVLELRPWYKYLQGLGPKPPEADDSNLNIQYMGEHAHHHQQLSLSQHHGQQIQQLVGWQVQQQQSAQAQFQQGLLQQQQQADANARQQLQDTATHHQQQLEMVLHSSANQLSQVLDAVRPALESLSRPQPLMPMQPKHPPPPPNPKLGGGAVRLPGAPIGARSTSTTPADFAASSSTTAADFAAAAPPAEPAALGTAARPIGSTLPAAGAPVTLIPAGAAVAPWHQAQGVRPAAAAAATAAATSDRNHRPLPKGGKQASKGKGKGKVLGPED